MSTQREIEMDGAATKRLARRRIVGAGLAAAIAATFLFAPGCHTGGAGDSAMNAADASKMLESEALKTYFALILAGVVNEQAKGGAAPPGSDSPEYPTAVIDAMRVQFPGLFTVSAATEARYKRHEFDEAANRATVSKLVGKATAHGAALPSVGAYLVKEFHGGRVEGPYLEMMRRIFEAYDRAGMLGGK